MDAQQHPDPPRLTLDPDRRRHLLRNWLDVYTFTAVEDARRAGTPPREPPTPTPKASRRGPWALSHHVLALHAAEVDGSTPVETMAARFRALGDPTRLRVVRELLAGTRCVCELRDQVGVAGPLLSHHLAVLRDAGLVTATRRGRWVDYTLTPDSRATVEHLGLHPSGTTR